MNSLKHLLLIASACLPGVALCAADTQTPLAGALGLYRASAAQPRSPLPLGSGKALTLSARLIWTNAQPCAILGWQGKAGRSPLRLYVAKSNDKPTLTAEVNTGAHNTPLRLSMPLAPLDLDQPHDIVVRFSGARLELFADGVLVDEDWPLGAILPAEGSLKLGEDAPAAEKFNGLISQVAVWDRALSDDEVLAVSGGRDGLAAREDRILGPQLPVGQLWSPRGFNAHVGDCMPFFHDGRFHLYYLFDRRNHQSKWGLGAHQWAHVSTTNLLNWEYHPMAVPITEQREGSICTGSTFFHDGTYYGFYAVRMADGSPAELCAATSPDGIHFTKNPPLTKLAAPYEPSSGRDPVVFREKATGLFHMLVTTSLNDPALANRGGCLAELVSTDLKHWEQRAPFYVPGYPGQPECPDYFEWNGWYYLVFSNDGIARYRMSRNPLGPWLRPAVDAFDVSGISVLKTAAFTGGRRIGAAFLSRGGYGGDVLFREIIQHTDGTLGTKWPAEMLPAAGNPVALKLAPLAPGVSGDGASVSFSGAQGLTAASLGATPQDFVLRMRVTPSARDAAFGLRLRGDGKMHGGLELRIEPQRQKAGLRDPNLNTVDESAHSSLYNVEGLGKPFDLEVLAIGDIIDVCIDHRRTLAVRRSTRGDTLFLFAHDSQVSFDSIELRPLQGR